jgi:phosphoenolpyruvate---glycerone phosphotransferase subunit DhaL
MSVDTGKLIDAVSARIIGAVEELTALESAIGDGDHGFNMERGFKAVLAERDAIAAKPLPEALKAIGMKLVSTVGGAAGPLFGTLFMTLGKEMPADPAPADVSRALHAAVAALMARGKAEFGQKTMLDVLGPVATHLGGESVTFASVRAAAKAASESTIGMMATRGRASFLGERSIGHMDPGSRSSAIIIEAVCDVLEGAT